MAQSVQIKDRTSNANLSVNSDGSLNSVVSGTVTATPTGTQVVSGTVTTVPSGTQTVTGTVIATPSGTQAVSGLVSTYSVMNPAFTGVYVYNLPDQPGVVAANNFLSIFNPVASGKTIVFVGGSVSSYIGGGGNATEVSCIAYRTTAASAGTLQAASAICKLQTAFPNAVAEVRIANPTATTGAAWFAIPPPIQPSTSGFIYALQPPSGSGSIVMVPGEGIVLRSTSGDTDIQWNFNVVWGEF